MERIHGAYRKREGIRITYVFIRCLQPSECSRRIEEALNSAGLSFTSLVDPDCYSLVSTVEDLEADLSIIEVRGEINRVFYVVPSPRVPNFRESGEEFRLAFKSRSAEGLSHLARYICEGKIGKRHANRSIISLVISMLVGLASQAITEGLDLLIQVFVTTALALIVFSLLEYLLLGLKGVDTIEKD